MRGLSAALGEGGPCRPFDPPSPSEPPPAGAGEGRGRTSPQKEAPHPQRGREPSTRNVPLTPWDRHISCTPNSVHMKNTILAARAQKAMPVPLERARRTLRGPTADVATALGRGSRTRSPRDGGQRSPNGREQPDRPGGAGGGPRLPHPRRPHALVVTRVSRRCPGAATASLPTASRGRRDGSLHTGWRRTMKVTSTRSFYRREEPHCKEHVRLPPEAAAPNPSTPCSPHPPTRGDRATAGPPALCTPPGQGPAVSPPRSSTGGCGRGVADAPEGSPQPPCRRDPAGRTYTFMDGENSESGGGDLLAWVGRPRPAPLQRATTCLRKAPLRLGVRRRPRASPLTSPLHPTLLCAACT